MNDQCTGGEAATLCASPVWRRIAVMAAIVLLTGAGDAGARTAEGDVAFERGARALRQGDAAAAVGFLEPVAQAEADDAAFQELYARALLQAGRPVDARPVLAGLRALDPDRAGLSFLEGVAAFRAGDKEAAIPLLQAAVQENPNDGRAHLLLGSSLQDVGQFDAAEVSLREAARVDPSLQAPVSYRLGVLAAQRDDWAAAESYFADVELQAPNSGLARAAEAYSQSRGRSAPAKPWQVHAKAGLAWDTNVNLRGQGDAILSGRDSDLRGMLEVGGRYTAFQNDWVRARVGHTSYFTFHAKQNDFDIYAARTWAEGRVSFTRQVGMDLRYTFEYALADYDSFRRTHRVEPGLWFNPAPGLLLRGFYRYEDRSFFLDRRFRELDRDGQLRTAGVDLYVPIPDFMDTGKGFLRIGYRNRQEDTSGDNFDSRGNGGMLTLGVPLPLEFFATFHGYYERRRFAKPSLLDCFERRGAGTVFLGQRCSDSSARGRRDDHIKQVRVALRKKLTEYLTGEVSYRKTHWTSNVPDFQFSRSIYGAQVTFRY